MEKEVAAAFNKQWHEEQGGTWHTMRWLGVKVLKTPCDLFIYQEIIHKVKPAWIIETGTCFGGSALYLATVCDGMGKGQIISIDINIPKTAVKHPRIEFYQGSSTDKQTVAHVAARIRRAPGPVLVILDSNHKKKHVLRELNLYSWFVTRGSYMIVEDTCTGRTVQKQHGPGPGDAVDEFMKANRDFVVDEGCEKYHLTFNPGGYLKCVR